MRGPVGGEGATWQECRQVRSSFSGAPATSSNNCDVASGAPTSRACAASRLLLLQPDSKSTKAVCLLMLAASPRRQLLSALLLGPD